MSIKVKRVYDKAEDGDGLRILVDRIWPRGLSKEKAKIDKWIKEISPSTELRKWYNHDPEKWNEFKDRYFKELQDKSALIDDLFLKSRKQTISFLFSSKETKYNNAHALKEYIETTEK